MRLLLAILALLVAVAAVIWFTMPQLVPEPWRPRSPATPDAGMPATSSQSATAADNPALYKWRDDQGVWNVTDRPPPDRPYERVVVDPNQNVVPTVVPAWAQPADASSEPEPAPPR
jgi:hypothetical protein